MNLVIKSKEKSIKFLNFSRSVSSLFPWIIFILMVIINDSDAHQFTIYQQKI